MPRTAATKQSSALGTKKKATKSNNDNPPKRHKNERHGWADGLLKFLDEPTDPAVVYCDDDFIAIKDKYPKAKCHYLVMPRDRKYRSLKDLTEDDEDMLRNMEGVANYLVNSNNENGDPTLVFKYGFHAVQSMNHLHMHVISQDFDSPCLKNKKHWNSFTTTFFVPLEEVLINLEKGEVDFSYRETRLNGGLKCHRCGKVQCNIPTLKQHIAGCDYDPTPKDGY
jgi:aprataxin